MSPRVAGLGLAMLLLVSAACAGDDSPSSDEPTARATNTPSSNTTATAQASSTARPSSTTTASATVAASPTTAGAATTAPSATTAAQPTQPTGGAPTAIPPTSVPPTTAPPPPTQPSGAPLQAFVTATAGDRWAPASVTIAAGGTVFWSWDTVNVHDLQGPGFASGIGTPVSFSHTFPAAGSYAYVCTIHPLMRGTVNVQ